MGPWAAQCVVFLCLHFPLHTIFRHHRHLRRDMLRLSLHITGVALLVKLYPPLAWACSTHSLLHISNPYTLPVTLATLTVCPHADITIAYALVWPALVDTAVFVIEKI